MNLGNKIYELRRTKNLSQENLADILGVTRQTVSKWETNQSLPDLDKVVPLCKVFEISVEELLGNVEGVVAEAEVENDGVGVTSNVMASENEVESEKLKVKDDNVKEKFRKRSAIVVSAAVFAYIVAVAILIAGVSSWGWNPVTAISIFLIIVGGATAAIIWNFMSMPKLHKEEKAVTKKEKITSQINSILWTVTVIIYFLISFPTGAWHITWVIFVIAALCTQIVQLVISLSDDDKNSDSDKKQI